MVPRRAPCPVSTHRRPTHDHARHESTTSTEKAAAPAPEDPRKPDSPDDITKPSWLYVLRKTLREFAKDQCTDLAAALTYYAVLAIAPALLAVVSILGLVGDPQKMVDGRAEDRQRRRASARSTTA